jgi:hypothetical protein
MTAAEAAEWGKTLSFETVWAAITRNDELITRLEQSMERRAAEAAIEAERRAAEAERRAAEAAIEAERRATEMERKFAETRQSLDRLDHYTKRISRNIGGVNRTFGKWAEHMVAPRLCEKFNTLGYEFTKAGPNVKFFENGQRLAEVDVFLENGEYAIPVEVKSDLTQEDIDEHLKRIAKLRYYMDKRNDNRKLVGAVAGVIVPESVCKYAQKNGLYVLMQSGKSVDLAEAPEGFSPRKW